MLKLLLFTALLCLMSACGQSANMSEPKFVIAGIGHSSTGVLLVTAIEQQQQLIVRRQMKTDSASFDLPPGSWVFLAHYWNSEDLNGASVRCAKSEAVLDGTDVTVTLSMTIDQCKTTYFNKTAFLEPTLNQVQDIDFIQCSIFISPTDDCSNSPGEAQSFRLVFPNIPLSSTLDPNLDSEKGFSNSCISFSSELFESSIKIPAGIDIANVPFVVKTYTTPDCTVGERSFPFKHGLNSSNSANQKIVDDSVSSPQRTRVYVKSFPDVASPLSASVATLNLPAGTNYSFDLSEFVTGGIPTINYSLTGDGSLSGSILTPPASSGSATITITDASGDIAGISIIYDSPSISHDFSGGAANTWTSSRSSSAFSSVGVVNNTPQYTNQSPATLRFHRTIKNTIPETYLLAERGATNRMTYSRLISPGYGWNTPGTASINAEVFDDFGTGLEVSQINKLTPGGTGSNNNISKTTPTAGVGNFVASVYLKAQSGSSIVGLYLANPAVSCKMIVVNLIDGQLLEGGSFCSGNIKSGIEEIGNGWYRVWLSENMTGANATFSIYPAWNSTLSTVQDINATGSILAWGAQIELSPSVSSLISTAATPFARSNEILMNNDAIMNNITSEEGTLYLDWHDRYDSTPGHIFSVCDGGNLPLFELKKSAIGRVDVASWNSIATNLSSDQNFNRKNKSIFTYNATSMSMSLNGGASSTLVRNFSPTTATSSRFGTNCSSGNATNVGIKILKYWNVDFHPKVIEMMGAP